jgi:hypothetical protein
VRTRTGSPLAAAAMCRAPGSSALAIRQPPEVMQRAKLANAAWMSARLG